MRLFVCVFPALIFYQLSQFICLAGSFHFDFPFVYCPMFGFDCCSAKSSTHYVYLLSLAFSLSLSPFFLYVCRSVSVTLVPAELVCALHEQKHLPNLFISRVPLTISDLLFTICVRDIWRLRVFSLFLSCGYVVVKQLFDVNTCSIRS